MLEKKNQGKIIVLIMLTGIFLSIYKILFYKEYIFSKREKCEALYIIANNII